MMDDVLSDLYLRCCRRTLSAPAALADLPQYERLAHSLSSRQRKRFLRAFDALTLQYEVYAQQCFHRACASPFHSHSSSILMNKHNFIITNPHSTYNTKPAGAVEPRLPVLYPLIPLCRGRPYRCGQSASAHPRSRRNPAPHPGRAA